MAFTHRWNTESGALYRARDGVARQIVQRALERVDTHGFGCAFNLVMIGLEALVVAGLADDQRCRDDRRKGVGDNFRPATVSLKLSLTPFFLISNVSGSPPAAHP
jgi:hypothetical protein